MLYFLKIISCIIFLIVKLFEERVTESHRKIEGDTKTKRKRKRRERYYWEREKRRDYEEKKEKVREIRGPFGNYWDIYSLST